MTYEKSRHVVLADADGRCSLVHPEKGRCSVIRGVGTHHVVFRSAGGSHDPENLIAICGAHHELIHERRLHRQGDGGELTFYETSTKTTWEVWRNVKSDMEDEFTELATMLEEGVLYGRMAAARVAYALGGIHEKSLWQLEGWDSWGDFLADRGFTLSNAQNALRFYRTYYVRLGYDVTDFDELPQTYTSLRAAIPQLKGMTRDEVDEVLAHPPSEVVAASQEAKDEKAAAEEGGERVRLTARGRFTAQLEMASSGDPERDKDEFFKRIRGSLPRTIAGVEWGRVTREEVV